MIALLSSSLITYLFRPDSDAVVFCKNGQFGSNVASSSLKTAIPNGIGSDEVKMVPKNSPLIFKLLLMLSKAFCLSFIQCKQKIESAQSYFLLVIKSSAKQCSNVRLSLFSCACAYSIIF